MDYYKEIKTKILDNVAYERIKDYSKERHRVLTYFEIGRLLHEAGKHYGDSIIKKYSERLSKELGSKYNERALWRMRQFYVIFSNTKMFQAGAQLISSKQLSMQVQSSLATLLKSEDTLNKGQFINKEQKK